MVFASAFLASSSSTEAENAEAKTKGDPQSEDDFYRDVVIPEMTRLRQAVDAMERLCGKDYWPVPSYNKMLFYV